jgi:hypothetical protein
MKKWDLGAERDWPDLYYVGGQFILDHLVRKG